MHSTLIGDGVMLLASDMMRESPVVGNTMSLMLQLQQRRGNRASLFDVYLRAGRSVSR